MSLPVAVTFSSVFFFGCRLLALGIDTVTATAGIVIRRVRWCLQYHCADMATTMAMAEMAIASATTMTMATTKCDNDKLLLTRGDDIGNDNGDGRYGNDNDNDNGNDKVRQLLLMAIDSDAISYCFSSSASALS